MVLAGAALLFGNMGWGAVVLNHAFQALLPLAAYGMGLQIYSRFAGWLAAVFAMCLLQSEFRAERIMSEAVYATLASFGMLLYLRGLALSRPSENQNENRRVATTCSPSWFLAAGAFLGAAWLTRPAAIALIAASIVLLLWTGRHNYRPGIQSLACFLFPLAAAGILECSINHRFAGAFRPGTNTLGPALLMRARAYLGLPWTDSEAAQGCLALLPERSPEDAYLVNRHDTWVAWYRATHDRGWDEWEVNRLMRTAALEMIASHPREALSNSAKIFARCLLRRTDGPTLSRVPEERRRSEIPPDASNPTFEAEDKAYFPWALPKRSPGEAAILTARMLNAGRRPAPLGTEPWRTLGSIAAHPLMFDALQIVRDLARVWPGFALLFCGPLALNRRACGFLILAYLLDAIVVATMLSSDHDLARYQYVWLTMDAALTAALFAAVLERSFRPSSPAPATLR